MCENHFYKSKISCELESEQLNFLNNAIYNYYNQVEILESLKKIIDTIRKNINGSETIKTNFSSNVTEEEIKSWYDEDCFHSSIFIPFETYKNDIIARLDNIDEKSLPINNKYLIKILNQRENEYIANLKYMLDIKIKLKNLILKNKNSLELSLAENRIKLSNILLEQQRFGLEYDEKQNISNYDRATNLRNNYDEIWIDIRKKELSLKYLDEILNLISSIEEENILINNELSPIQNDIYKKIIIQKEDQLLKNEDLIKENQRELLEEPSDKIALELASLVNGLKSMKIELSAEEIKEIEKLLR